MSLTCGHQRAYYSLKVIYEHGKPCRMISTAENSWFVHQGSLAFTSESPSSKGRGSGEGNYEFFVTKYVFHAWKGCQHDVKSYEMGPTALLPLRRMTCCVFLWQLKIHRPRPGMNPRTLGPIASMLTTRPPRMTKFERVWYNKITETVFQESHSWVIYLIISPILFCGK
jgi:hypothetical protein